VTRPKAYAPWTGEQVENLRRRQARRDLHPYTCPEHREPLEPTIYGWECPRSGCLYEQRWAHAIDAGPRPHEHDWWAGSRGQFYPPQCLVCGAANGSPTVVDDARRRGDL
jgi:hypothetical protein